MSQITESILDSTKKAVGIVPEYPYFDDQIIMYINSAFSTLYQLGVGPEDGFSISDNKTTWSEYTNSNKLLNFVKTYLHMSVQLMFAPPTSSFALEALKQQIKEYEWRINVMVDPKVLGGDA